MRKACEWCRGRLRSFVIYGYAQTFGWALFSWIQTVCWFKLKSFTNEGGKFPQQLIWTQSDSCEFNIQATQAATPDFHRSSFTNCTFPPHSCLLLKLISVCPEVPKPGTVRSVQAQLRFTATERFFLSKHRMFSTMTAGWNGLYFLI